MLEKLKGLFGKRDKFFRELKEDASNVVGQAVEQAEKAIEKTTDTISQVVDSKADAPAKAVKAVEAKAAKAVNNAKAEKAAPKAKEKKTSIKDKKGKPAAEAKPVAETKPAPTVSQNGKVDPTEVAFASKSTVASTMSRRTPGPSLNTFKEMARQAKVPSKKG
ncbi:hypothetical protein [Chroococcus sp. FPU101]|uniref:hypothetical protein n=1 Tax=Chroococcus sp. FPU101 TaxID=1974212 RepID=UPI001A90846A|nr:hypothetical protein [Chroococcus sp. FPU101]GFE69730.1 hypothetical protein CFPU101_23400 [Chroococcus sp. FPU101]